MTDLDAIIQAAEEVEGQLLEARVQPNLDQTDRVAIDTGSFAFRTFANKLKALRQGIYG